jgi:hypothetical protein
MQQQTSNIYVATPHDHLYMAYISLKWFDIQGPALHTISFWVQVDYRQTRWCYSDFKISVRCQRFARSMAVTMI